MWPQRKSSRSYIARLHGQSLIEGALTQSLIELHFMDSQVGVAGTAPVAAAKDAHRNRESLVVDEASVDGENGHQQQHVPPCSRPTALAQCDKVPV